MHDQWQVTAPASLLECLAHRYPQQSRRTLRQWVQHERVHVEGKLIIKVETPCAEGAWIELFPWTRILNHSGASTSKSKSSKKSRSGQTFNQREPKSSPRLYTQASPASGGCRSRLGTEVVVLYEDDEIIVVDKPWGLLSVADDQGVKKNLFSIVKENYPNAWVIHRLDAKTQGVMIFAKGADAGRRYKELIHDKIVQRRYLAICHGQFLQESGTWYDRLWEDKAGHVHVLKDKEVRPNSFEAVTHYRLLTDAPGISLVEFELETGKKHQIRVQASDQGHAVVGDERYGIDDGERMALLSWQIAWPKVTSPALSTRRCGRAQQDLCRNDHGGAPQGLDRKRLGRDILPVTDDVIPENSAIERWVEVYSHFTESFEKFWMQLARKASEGRQPRSR